jgi:hypothetical protein
MRSFDHDPITVGKPNWAPLEMLLSPRECEDYMYAPGTSSCTSIAERDAISTSVPVAGASTDWRTERT